MSKNTGKSTALFPEVGRMSLSKQVADTIREAILSGSIRPGTQLVEADIAKQMNTSRAPVREALRRLGDQGLVEHEPYKGVFVTPVSQDDIWELYSFRSAIEVLAVRLAIQHATEDDIKNLEAILKEMLQAAQASDSDNVTVLDLSFHSAIYRMAGHKLLLEVWHDVEQKVRFIMALRHHGLHRKLREVVQTHQPLLESIQARDGDRAAELIAEHILSSSKLVLDAWAENEVIGLSPE